MRQLKGAAMSRRKARQIGIEHQRDIMGLRLILKSLECIADHIEAIAQKLIKINAPHEAEIVAHVSRYVLELYDITSKSTLQFNAVRAEEIFKKLPAVREEISISEKHLQKSMHTPETVITLHLCLESYYWITRHCSDIAEIVINMHAEVPERHV